MRRNTLNKFSIILILLVAISTLASYVFDQLAIQTEDKIRKTNIKLDNQKIAIYKFSNLISDFNTINENSKLIVKNSLKYKNLWIKSLLINELYKDDNTVKKFFKDLDYTKDQVIKSQLIDIFLEKMRDNWNIYNKIYTLKGRHNFLFNNIDYDELDKFFQSEEIIEKNKKRLMIKNFNYFNLLSEQYWKGEKRMSALKNFKFEHWLDIHFLTLKFIENIHLGSMKYIEPKLNQLNIRIGEAENIKKQISSNLEKITAVKNQYILLSIISQIFSLLFLLIFFRDLILKYKI